jgi:ribosomal protein L11 methylase PrmA
MLPVCLVCCPLVCLSAAAALLMGASSAVGTDTDPLAVRAAEANAGLNGMQGRFTVLKCGANLNDADPLLQVSVLLI